MSSNRIFGAGQVVQWGEESIYGTPVAGTEIVFIQNEGLTQDTTFDDEGGIVANVGTSGKFLSSISVGGNLQLVAKPENMKHLFKHLTGSNPTASTVVTGVDSYTYTPIESGGTLPSSTILANIGKEVKRYTGMRISKVDFSLAEKKMVEITIDFMGVNRDIGTMAPALVAPTKKSYRFSVSSMTIGGTAVADVYSIKATYDNGMIAGKNVLGGGLVPQEPDIGERLFTADFECALSTQAVGLRASMMNETPVAITITCKSPEIITSTYHEQFQIVIPAFLITKYEANIPGKDEITAKISGQAVMSGSDFVSIVLQTPSA